MFSPPFSNGVKLFFECFKIRSPKQHPLEAAEKRFVLCGCGSKPFGYLFGDDYPSNVVYFKGFWNVHPGTGVVFSLSYSGLVLGILGLSCSRLL